MAALPLAKPLRIGVIGPAGFGGSYLSLELIYRGHHVIGISRTPQSLGTHPLYTPISTDINDASISFLAETFKAANLDVLVNEYGPHSAGQEALKYMPFVEITRKIVLAVKAAEVPYFIMVGGCGSLYMPNSGHQNVLENKEWWLAYRRGIADSEAHVRYMEERLGSMGKNLREYRNARIKMREGRDNEESRKVSEEYERHVVAGDAALEFIKACRATFMFFDGNTSFRWTFVSPSALYRPGKRTGKYERRIDFLPLKGDTDDPTNLDGRLHGISAADLAVAIADEAERQEMVGKHWSAWSDLSDDEPRASYVTLDQLRNVQ